MIFSAIDIGSNALRMMTVEMNTERYSIIDKLRSPVRIGHDVFSNGRISKLTMDKAVDALKAFVDSHNHLLATRRSPETQPIGRIRAVATSALRDAENRKQFLATVHKRVGIEIEIISGIQEAQLIQRAILDRCPNLPEICYTLDIGGGSVEVGKIKNQHIKWSESLPLGTVRCLQELRTLQLPETQACYWIAQTWMNHQDSPLASEIQRELAKPPNPSNLLVGTGGNMESILDLSRSMKLTNKNSSLITRANVAEICDQISRLNQCERIHKYKLRVDRSDVIIPAIHVTLFFMRQLGCGSLLVPKVGLRDGIIIDQLDQKHH